MLLQVIPLAALSNVLPTCPEKSSLIKASCILLCYSSSLLVKLLVYFCQMSEITSNTSIYVGALQAIVALLPNG